MINNIPKYLVEKIFNKTIKKARKGTYTEYLIKKEGYLEYNITWEKAKNLNKIALHRYLKPIIKTKITVRFLLHKIYTYIRNACKRTYKNAYQIAI